MSVLKEFREFAVKGNVMDLAIGVVIGAAFGKIVESLVGDIIMPVIGAIAGGLDFSNYFFPLSHSVTATSLLEARKQGAVFAWGNFGINNLVTQTPFDVTPLRLFFTANPTSQSITLLWSNNMGAFDLCCTPSLTRPAIWTPVTNIPYFATNRWSVVDSTASSPQRFYRLQQ